MPTYNKLLTIQVLSKRLEDPYVLKLLRTEQNFRDIFEGKRYLGRNVMADMFGDLETPEDFLENHKLKKVSMTQILLAHKISGLMLHRDFDTANELLIKLESGTKNCTIAKQEHLLLKARLWLLENKPDSSVLELIDSGIKLTYHNYSDEKLGNTAFIFHEPDLVFLKAKVTSKSQPTKAIDMLLSLLEDLSLYAMTDYQKNRQLAQIHPILCNLLYEAKRYNEAADYCYKGTKLTIEVSSGKDVPDYEYLTAKIKYKQTKDAEYSRIHLMHAFAGYLLLGEKEKAESIVEAAKSEFRITLDLYGMDSLFHLIKPTKVVLSRGIPVECKTIAQLINNLCNEKGIKPSKIYNGIIKKQAFYKALNEKSDFSYFNAEAMGQRLGIDIRLYEDFLLNDTEYKMIQLRDSIHVKLVQSRFDGFDEELNELRELNKKAKQSSIDLFVEYADISKKHSVGEISNVVLRNEMESLLKTVHPTFNVFDFEKLNLTHTELSIVNHIAWSYGEQEFAIAVRIYEQLLSLHRRLFLDEVEGDKTLGMIYENYSSKLGMMEDFNNAHVIAKGGLEYELSCQSLVTSYTLIYNIGYIYWKQKKSKADLIPFFALSYFSANSLAQHRYTAKECATYANEKIKNICDVDIYFPLPFVGLSQ